MIKSISNEDLKKAESILFNNLKNNIKPYKSKRFLYYMAVRNPGKEIHHLLGSYSSLKGTDFLTIPVTRAEHQLAEKNKSEIGIANLSEAINFLLDYMVTLEITTMEDALEIQTMEDYQKIKHLLP